MLDESRVESGADRVGSVHFRRPSSVLVAALPLSYGLAAPAAIGLGSDELRLVLAGLGVMVAALASAYYSLRTTGSRLTDWWLQPSALAFVVAGLSFGAAPLTWLDPNLETGTFFRRGDVIMAQTVALLGIWFAVAGLAWARRRKATPVLTNRFGLEPRFASAHLVAFGVGIGSTALLAAMDRFSYLGDPEAALATSSSLPQILSLLAPLALYGAVMTFWHGLTSNSHRQIVLGSLMGLVVMVIGLMGGSKQPVVVPAVALLATYRLARGRLPRHLLVAAFIGMAALFVFNPLYRANLRGQNLAPGKAFEEALGDTGRSIIDAPLAVLGDGVDSILRRLRNVDSLAIIVSRTPDEIPYRSLGSVPANVGSALIPRVLWPEKPPVADGYEFAIEYYERDPSIYSSTAVTLIGGLYRHGGVWVVLIGGLLLGWYLCALDRLANPLYSPGGLVPFIALAIPLAKAESGLPVTISGQLQGGLVILVLMLVFLAPTKGAPRSIADRTKSL